MAINHAGNDKFIKGYDTMISKRKIRNLILWTTHRYPADFL